MLKSGVGFTHAGVCVAVARGAATVDFLLTDLTVTPTQVSTITSQVAAKVGAGATVASSVANLNTVASDFAIPACGSSTGKAGKTSGGTTAKGGKMAKDSGKAGKGKEAGKASTKGSKRQRRAKAGKANKGATTQMVGGAGSAFVSGNTLCTASYTGAKPALADHSVALSSIAGFAVGALVVSRRSSVVSSEGLNAPLLETHDS